MGTQSRCARIWRPSPSWPRCASFSRRNSDRWRPTRSFLSTTSLCRVGALRVKGSNLPRLTTSLADAGRLVLCAVGAVPAVVNMLEPKLGAAVNELAASSIALLVCGACGLRKRSEITISDLGFEFTGNPRCHRPGRSARCRGDTETVSVCTACGLCFQCRSAGGVPCTCCSGNVR
jgi:hypothetical protein